MSTLSRHHELSLYAFLFALSPIGSLAAQTLSPTNTNATTYAYGACGPPPRDVEENARCRALCFDANTPSTQCHDNCVSGQLPGSNITTDPVPDPPRFAFLFSYGNRTLVLSWGNSEKDDAVKGDEAATATPSNYSATASPTSSAMRPSAAVIYAIERTCTPTKDCHSSEKQPHAYYVNEEQRQILLPYPHFNGKAMYCAWAVSQYAVRPISSFPIEISPTVNLDVKSLNIFPFVRPPTTSQIDVAVSWTCPSCNFSWATEFEVYVSRDQDGKNTWCSKPWSRHFTNVTRTSGYDSFVLASDNWRYQCSYAMTIMVKSLHRLEVIAETEAFTIPDHFCMLHCTNCLYSYEVDENLFPPNTVIYDVCPDDPCNTFAPEKAAYFNTSNFAFIKLPARDGGWKVDTTFVWTFTSSNETCRDVIDSYSITTHLLDLRNGEEVSVLQKIHPVRDVNSTSKTIRLQPNERYRAEFSSVTKYYKTSPVVQFIFVTPTVPLSSPPPTSLLPTSLLPTSLPSSSPPPSSSSSSSSSSSQWSISIKLSLGLGLGCGLIGIVLIILIIGVIVAKQNAPKEKLDELSLSSRSPSPGPSVPVIPPDEWEVNRSRVMLGKNISEGAFGYVIEGQLLPGSISHGRTLRRTKNVAIKMSHRDVTEGERIQFRKEIDLMKTIGLHRNVVEMIGCCTEKEPVFLILERLPYGDLLSFLRKSRKKRFGALEDDDDSPTIDVSPDGSLSRRHLLSMAMQIASGMEHISTLRLIHRDLAARNVLVDSNLCLKVSDFGLSRDIYLDSAYCNTRHGRLPVKWMAIEALIYRNFTVKSDVWSYGIVIWEIATLGAFPYPTIPAYQLPKQLLSGYRMERPATCPEDVYDSILLQCWEENPEKRPTFTELKTTVEQWSLLEPDSGEKIYVDFDGEDNDGIPEGHFLPVDDCTEWTEDPVDSGWENNDENEVTFV